MKYLNRFLALMLAALFAVGMTSSVCVAEEVDPFVIDFDVTGNGYDGPKFYYFTPYVTDYTYDGEATYVQIYVRTLYNTVTQEEIPAYCMDIKKAAESGHSYQQLNLEDSSYAASMAGLLRAIIINGFYLEPISGESNDEHAVRVAAKLQELGAAAGVEGLTIGEAVAATQAAVWRTSHGARLEFTDFLRTIFRYGSANDIKYYALCAEERNNGHVDYTVGSYSNVTINPESDAWINSRIRAVYDYLLALEPIEPDSVSVSPASFLSTTKGEPVENEDGTFNLNVTATVDVQMSEGDNLTLTASIADTYYASEALSDGEQEVELTIEGIAAEDVESDIKLQIDGSQLLSDVYLYEAYGGREANQAMIGRSSRRMPVHAEIIAQTNRILNFYKTTNSGSIPLEGISFDIYFAADMDAYLNGEVEMPDPATFNYPETPTHTVITDAEGKASVNLTQHGLPDGIYIVVEREHPAIVAPVAPFTVTVPMGSINNSDYHYVIPLQMKNEVKGNVNIDKDVGELGNDRGSAGIYENFEWIISTDVPEDIAAGKRYVITDDLDNRLDYMGNMRFRLESADAEQVILELVPDTDYTLTVHDFNSLEEGKPHDSFELELTETGMGKVAAAIGTNSYGEYKLRVYFETCINANVQMGEEITNDALLEYTNSVNIKFEARSGATVVTVGGANVLKVDANDNSVTLEGAQFQLFRNATEKEVAQGEDLIYLEGIVQPLMQESFYTTLDFSGVKLTHTTTDANGRAGIYGIPYGEYYILESKAPDGYNLVGTPIKIVIDETSHLEENAIVVENISGTMLPATGGSGTTGFTVFGIALICTSMLLLMLKKKRND